MDLRQPVSPLILRWTALGAGAVVALGMWLVLERQSALYDADAYFHLAVARRYAREGLFGGLPWARFSLMHDGFGDKELLFHLLMAPLVALSGPVGGRLMLALLNGLVGAVIARLAAPVLGAWAAALPVGLYLASLDYLDRMLRLRPEQLLLLWLLLATGLAAGGRRPALAGVAFLLTWSHTGFPILLPICAAWVAWDWLATRRLDARLFYYCVLGMALALLLHPQTPNHLGVWWAQNVERFRMTLPDQGAEFQPNTLIAMVKGSGGLFLALLALVAARIQARTGEPAPPTTTFERYASIAAIVFGVLFAYLTRFATLFVPFATLAAVYALPRPLPVATTPAVARGLRRGACSLLLIGSVALSWRTPVIMQRALEDNGVQVAGFEPLGRQFGRLIPKDAKVAASISDAEFYVYCAPWGRYLNLLDPVFMAVPYPDAYQASLAIFDGREPDVPLTAAAALDSDYVALFSPQKRVVGHRLSADPRVTRMNVGLDSLFSLNAGENTGFILEWRVAPPAGQGPETAKADSGWPPYPRAETERARSLEGYVDVRRVGDGGTCRLLLHELVSASATSRFFEFAPYGAGELWVDGRLVVAVLGPRQAILGDGVVVPLSLSPGAHTIAVRSCPHEQYNGFYLLDRSRTARP